MNHIFPLREMAIHSIEKNIYKKTLLTIEKKTIKIQSF